MVTGDKESSLMKKRNKRSHKRKREEDFERIDSLPWSSSIPIGEDDEGESFSTLFSGSGQLDGGFLSLEEIDEADYHLTLPTIESEITERKQSPEDDDDTNETVDEMIEGEEAEEDGEGRDDEDDEDDEETRKKKEKKAKRNKEKKKEKKKKKQKKINEAAKNQDASAG
jgi:ATP-dependent RNA helicase DDX24/MAK5